MGLFRKSMAGTAAENGANAWVSIVIARPVTRDDDTTMTMTTTMTTILTATGIRHTVTQSRSRFSLASTLMMTTTMVGAITGITNAAPANSFFITATLFLVPKFHSTNEKLQDQITTAASLVL